MPSKTADQVKDWNLAKIQEKTFQIQTLLGEFAFTIIQIFEISFDYFDDSMITSPPLPIIVNFALVKNPIYNPNTIYDNKLAKALAFYAW